TARTGKSVASLLQLRRIARPNTNTILSKLATGELELEITSGPRRTRKVGRKASRYDLLQVELLSLHVRPGEGVDLGHLLSARRSAPPKRLRASQPGPEFTWTSPIVCARGSSSPLLAFHHDS